MKRTFDEAFDVLTGNEPFPWQRALHERLLSGDIPPSCDIPTGLGKTLVIAVWLLARAAGAPVPRRLVYVVNRRTVVDQTTDEVGRLRENLARAGVEEELAISTLRGQMADNRAWSADPSQPAVICGTVDMIGSRLLFSGYRLGFRTRPLHAGFLGQDALLVHDEAHLEPAFQHLLETIQAEQKRQGDRWPLRVMALTATPRRSAEALRLGADDFAHPVVARRLHAVKKLRLHPHGDKDLVEKVVTQALGYAPSGHAVLVFLRTVEDVVNAVSRLRKADAKVQQLIGTMRGFERDRLVTTDPVFRRFLPESGATDGAETVFLVCTSAGEVGVNLSADHLVCDLSTFDSMAQRFGRVNRFGLRTDSEIHVFHPGPESLDTDKVRDAHRRLETLTLLQTLDGDASPAALAALDPERRQAAFAPEPRMLTASDILFDAWAMTTIRDALPGRPPVAPYLHGVAEWEPPTTHVAWRDEVGLVTGDLLTRYPAQELIDDYPLKPHELLTDRALRVLDTLTELADRHPDARSMPVWVVNENGRVDARKGELADLLDGDRKTTEASLAGCTLVLSPRHLRPVEGLLTLEGWMPASRDGIDVADAWLDESGRPMRQRLSGESPPPDGMRLIRTLVLGDSERTEVEEDSGSAEDEGSGARQEIKRWYERPLGADDEGSRSAEKPVLLEVHSADVEREARRIVERLPLDPGVKRAVVLAAKLHDIGKNRRVWQRSIGNTDRARVLAKSGGAMRPMDITPYRHEVGSMLEAEQSGLLAGLDPDDRELALHLVAAHHGRARPHFPPEEQFDPEAKGVDVREVCVHVMTRFATLQKRFGRWSLAYLESLVRAADYAASARPSQVVEVER
ncbi:type I-G CRISPR-associated helicase/endonuclease Cas3g [Sorangium sp. So ce362]|uniref:type I-G CRISPR-associated helicase/endonuclease Cas3g n=1 Tax=Sorangium sp. So ce362 TaxID=3133303 RepID=UPI003F5DDD62